MTMTWYEFVLTLVGAILASNGLWSLISRGLDKKSDKDKLLMGLAYSEIITRTEKYLERGYISTDEFNELDRYLYGPYKRRGGNGTAARNMEHVKTLPRSRPAPVPAASDGETGD